MHKLTNLNKILTYLILFLIIILGLYDIDNLSISFDSIDNYENTLFITDNNKNSTTNPSTTDMVNHTTLTSLSSYDKIRRWFHWRVYGNQKYVTMKKFNQSWKPTDNLKSKFKDEFKEFKKGPVDYLKKDIRQTREVIVQRKTFQAEIDKKTMFVEGQGWINNSDLRDLNRMGLTVKNSKIVKITK